MGGAIRAITFAALGQATQTLSGYSPTLDLYVPVPGQGAVGPHSVLQVTYSQSPLLDSRTSSISIYVNNAYLAGRLLAGRVGATQVLTVNVPASALTTVGLNHIQVAFSLKTFGAKAECGTASPDLNVTVYGTSSFRYDVAEKSAWFTPDLTELPSPFASPASPIAAPILVALPRQPSPTELTAAARILARMGQDYPSSPPSVVSASGASIPARAGSANLLVVGSPADNLYLPEPTPGVPFALRNHRWVDARGRPLPGSEGLIYEAPNPWNRRHAALVITANEPEGIRRAGVVLSSQTLRRLLHGSFTLVRNNPGLPPQIQIPGHVIPLTDLGYRSITIEGFGEHDARISFDMSQRTDQNGRIDLIFSHAGISPSDTSSLRVDLNGQPIGSRVFHSDDPDRIHWTVSLPPDLLVAGVNTITLRFFFTLPPSCTVPPGASSYGTVDGNSTIYLPARGIGGNPDLSLLPFPLVKDGSPNDLLLIVPARVSDQHDALQLALLIGVQCHVDAPQLEVSVPEQTSMRLLRSKTVLLNGLPSTNSLIAGMDAALPLHVAHGLRVSGHTPALTASLRESGALGVIEEIPAPWGPTQTAVIISASEPDLLGVADRSLFRGLSGTVATISRDGSVQTFDTRTPQQVSGVQTATRPITVLAAMGIVSLLLLLAVVLLQRRRGDSA